MAETIDTLIAETRARREALHSLIGRLRRDHDSWLKTAAQLPARARLTDPQRATLQRYVRRRIRRA